MDSHSTPTMIQIHLKKSKCDQAGRGADIVIGRTGCNLCPVSAILHYITTRGDQAGPFFVNSSKETITKAWFVAELLGSMGLPQHQYAGHSFRIGAATTAAMAGVEDDTDLRPLAQRSLCYVIAKGWGSQRRVKTREYKYRDVLRILVCVRLSRTTIGLLLATCFLKMEGNSYTFVACRVAALLLLTLLLIGETECLCSRTYTSNEPDCSTVMPCFVKSSDGQLQQLQYPRVK